MPKGRGLRCAKSMKNNNQIKIKLINYAKDLKQRGFQKESSLLKQIVFADRPDPRDDPSVGKPLTQEEIKWLNDMIGASVLEKAKALYQHDKTDDATWKQIHDMLQQILPLAKPQLKNKIKQIMNMSDVAHDFDVSDHNDWRNLLRHL